jgi:hypothetical protein
MSEEEEELARQARESREKTEELREEGRSQADEDKPPPADPRGDDADA